MICSKRTAYLTPPEQKFFEYDDEQEEFNPFEPYEDGKWCLVVGSPAKMADQASPVRSELNLG